MAAVLLLLASLVPTLVDVVTLVLLAAAPPLDELLATPLLDCGALEVGVCDLVVDDAAAELP